MTRRTAEVRCRIEHSATGEAAVELRRPIAQLEAWRISEVVAVLDGAEAAARRGHYVAGYVAYDAAPAFDACLRVPGPSGGPPRLPLAWFGVFGGAVRVAPLPTSDAPVPGGTRAPWRCEVDAGRHEGAVTAIRRAIAAGDAYLVNYTARCRRRWTDDDDAAQLYGHLVASHGPGYHAFIETAEWAVACGSPELFFEHVDGMVVTRPMKGTAPRGRWAEEDAIRGAELERSPKERAENVMVVDLLRNDLGKIAVPGTVTVPALWQAQRHPALWQLTSTVTARTEHGVGLREVFAALFPCASVTGAPKVSAMSVISDLEESSRGVYCGAVGFLEPATSAGSGGSAVSGGSAHPRARFSVAIRTAVVDKVGGVAHFGAGGGITWDSVPGLEWDELLLKARTLRGRPGSSVAPDHGLLETMRFVPDEGGGAVRDLAEHLARLGASAHYFGRRVPRQVEDLVTGAVAELQRPSRVRLVLQLDGSVEIETTALPPVTGTVLRLCVDADAVSSTDAGLFHKTTDRRRYDDRARRHPGADDVVLVNERGEVTETTRANLAVHLAGRWCTPPLDCGLLPGIARARAIADGRLVERVVTVADLHRASSVATLSSLRGWLPARVVPVCPC